MATNKNSKETVRKFEGCEEYDYITSYESAKCLWCLARIYAEKYEETQTLTPYELFASATNYGLVIELLLKTIISGESRKKLDKIHNLCELFEKINEDTRDMICNRYNDYISHNKPLELFLRGVTSKNPKEKFENSKSPNKERNKDVKSLLENNQDIFTQFRYMGEKARTEEVEYF